ncbi:unnamed protein product [Caretta caretta]
MPGDPYAWPYWAAWNPNRDVPLHPPHHPSPTHTTPLSVHEEPLTFPLLLHEQHRQGHHPPPLVHTAPLHRLMMFLSRPLCHPNDHMQYQDLLQCMATALNLPVKDVQVPQNQILDILQSPGPSCTILLIHENALMQAAQAVWLTLASCAPTPKWACAIISFPRRAQSLSTPTHPSPNSLVV